MIHYAPHTATTSCGIPLETPGVGAFSDERDLVAGCLSCAKAAAAVPTSCASCGYTYCECFEAGYAAALASRLRPQLRRQRRRSPRQPQTPMRQYVGVVASIASGDGVTAAISTRATTVEVEHHDYHQ